MESSSIMEEISVRVGASMHSAAITEKTKGQEMKRGGDNYLASLANMYHWVTGAKVRGILKSQASCES